MKLDIQFRLFYIDLAYNINIEYALLFY